MSFSIRKSKIKFGRSLTTSALSRYFSFSALYIAQGIPEGIIFYALPAWLAMNGKSALEIGAFTAIILIPWSFKILAAPLMDRFTYLAMGRKRPWIIFGQLGLILSFLSIGFVPDPINNIPGLMVVGFMISFFGAFQDVATDGMAVDVIPVNEQARANGLMWGTKIVGTSLSLVIGTALINSFGLTVAISSLSVAVALIILVPIYFTERPGEKSMPWSKGEANTESKKTQLRSWSQILKSLYKVIKLKASIIFGIATFIIGIMFGFMDTLFPIFSVQELEWTNTSFSQVFSTISIVAGVLGMLVGGYLVDRFGKIKMMTLYLGITTAIVSTFAFATDYWQHAIFIYAFMTTYYILYTFLSIAVFATGMHLCWKTVAATQFTLYMALSNMGRSVGATLLGVIKTHASWEYAFLFIALSPLVMAVMMQFVNFSKHRKRVESFSIMKKHFVTPSLIKD